MIRYINGQRHPKKLAGRRLDELAEALGLLRYWFYLAIWYVSEPDWFLRLIMRRSILRQYDVSFRDMSRFNTSHNETKKFRPKKLGQE